MSLKYKVIHPFNAELYEDILLDNIKNLIKRYEYNNLNKLIIQDLINNKYFNVNINYDNTNRAIINAYPIKNINNLSLLYPPPLLPALIPVLPDIVPGRKYVQLLPNIL